MAKKVPVEIKANVVKHFLATKCTFEALRRYVGTTYGYDVSKQAVMKWIKKEDEILKTQICIGKVLNLHYQFNIRI